MTGLLRPGPAALRVQPAFVDGAPLVVCRTWRDGDERRGMRSGRCIVHRCPNTLAVTASTWRMENQYICQADAASYGLPVGEIPPPPPVRRNDPCPCGSGHKHKNCHGRFG